MFGNRLTRKTFRKSRSQKATFRRSKKKSGFSSTESLSHLPFSLLMFLSHVLSRYMIFNRILIYLSCYRLWILFKLSHTHSHNWYYGFGWITYSSWCSNLPPWGSIEKRIIYLLIMNI